MPEPQTNLRRNHTLAFALFAVLTVLMTWPVITRLGSHLAGGRDDLWVHQWTFWWLREALRQGLNPFITPYLYAPIGASLTSHNIAWFNIALWLPLQALFGRVAGYNLVFLVVIILNGFCSYLFAWEVLHSYGSALVTGVIVGFWPYTLSHYDHANMMVIFWVPLALLFIHKLIHRSSFPHSPESGHSVWWLAAGASLSLAMIGISRWQLLIMSSPILLGYTLFLLWSNPAARSWKTIRNLLVVCLIAFVVVIPLASPLLIDHLTREFPEDVFLDEAIWGRTDLLAYFVPSIHNGLWQARVAPLYEQFVVNQFYTPFLGFVTLFLAAVGLLRRRAQSWIWFLLALLYFTLALGPELAVNGRAFPAIPMPYRLIEDLFLMRLIRRPDRLNIFLSLPLAMLAGWGMQAILSSVNKPGLRRLAVIAVILLILLAYLPVPFATTLPETPEWYFQAAAEEGSFSVLDLPINDRSYDKWYMQYQTDHGLPIATGHVSRLPRESLAFLQSVPLLADLEEKDQIPDPELRDIGRQLGLLSNAGIRYLILHKEFANEGLQAIWRDWLVADPAHEDDDVIVYRTALETGRDFHIEQQLTHEIGLVRVEYMPEEAVQQGVIKVEVVWGTIANPAKDLEVCLDMLDDDAKSSLRDCQAIDPTLPSTEWPGNDLRRAGYVLTLPADQGPGEYNLTLALFDPAEAAVVGEKAELGSITIHSFTPNDNPTTWLDDISLRASELNENDRDLNVTLYWQAEKRLDDSYKVFLHIVEPGTGEVIAQSDAIPRNWTYPTTAWEPGEIVRDDISIPLESLPSGSYEILVGLYDEQTGERLRLQEDVESSEEDTFMLTTWEH